MPNHSRYEFFNFYKMDEWNFGFAINKEFCAIGIWKWSFNLYEYVDEMEIL